jgi:3-deoxy-D-arabino-heptulosonate 7-phosphate (DAHP) synthase class II
VLNKALLHAYEMRAEQWWRPIAYEEDFATLNQVRWITVGGFSDLDTVAEGARYTSKRPGTTWPRAAPL